MSFGFQAAGRPAAVIQAIHAHPVHGDPSQFDKVRALVTTELEGWPEGKGVLVECNGHHDSYSRNLTISLRQITLAELTEDEKE